MLNVEGRLIFRVLFPVSFDSPGLSARGGLRFETGKIHTTSQVTTRDVHAVSQHFEVPLCTGPSEESRSASNRISETDFHLGSAICSMRGALVRRYHRDLTLATGLRAKSLQPDCCKHNTKCQISQLRRARRYLQSLTFDPGSGSARAACVIWHAAG